MTRGGISKITPAEHSLGRPCLLATVFYSAADDQMKLWLLSFAAWTASGLSTLHAQPIDLLKTRLQAVSVSFATKDLAGRSAVRVTKNPEVKAVDEATFVKLVETDFKNGTIDVDVLSRLLKDAPDFARGFIGVAFRINGDDSKFEGIYLRPTNGRAEDQQRRNRSVQYFSYPDYTFDRLRKEAPGVYESYADMGLDEWIKLRIEVKGKGQAVSERRPPASFDRE